MESYQNNLPEYAPTPEEDASGITDVSKRFGFAGTLYRVARTMSVDPQTILVNYTAGEFYHLVTFLSWENYTSHKYQEIMSKKKS